MNIEKALELFLHREKIEDTIFHAELMAESSKQDISTIYLKYANRIKNDFVANEIRDIARQIKGNHKKVSVYRDYLSSELIHMLELTTKEKIAPGPIFTEYAPIRRLAQKNKNKIKGALAIPMGIYLFVIFLLNAVMSNIEQAKSNIDFSAVSLFMFDYFFVLNIFIFIGVAFAFFVIPHKVPVLSRAFQKIDALVAIALTTSLMNLIPVKDIIPLIKKRFSLSLKNGRGDIAELVAVLESGKFLSGHDAADLEIAMLYGDVNKMLLEKKEDKNEDAKQFGEIVGELVKTLSNLLIALPAFQFVFIVLDLLASASSKV